MEFLTVGTIVRTIGLKGEVKVYPSTHFRDSRFSKGNHVFLLNENKEIEEDLLIVKHSKNGECDNLIFEGYDTIEKAEKFLKKDLFVIKDRNFLKKGEYFYSDLEGMDVYFDNGTLIGKVKKVEEYNSYATLRIAHSPKDVLVPFVKAFVLSVSLEEKKIVIKFIEGLL